MVDDEDYSSLVNLTWTFDKYGKPITWSKVDGKRGRSLRDIVYKPDYKKTGIYYIDENPLNNQKSNLSYSKNKISIYEGYGEIHLKDGVKSLFSINDIEIVKKYTWYLSNVGYAITDFNRKKVYLHRLIIEATDKQYVDHINLNKLDNRRENIRICTNGENQANRLKSNIKNKTSEYKGVSKNRNNWTVRVKRKRFGTYTNEIVAANVYNFHALEVFGEYARLNNVPYISNEEWDNFKV